MLDHINEKSMTIWLETYTSNLLKIDDLEERLKKESDINFKDLEYLVSKIDAGVLSSNIKLYLFDIIENDSITNALIKTFIIGAITGYIIAQKELISK